MMKLSITHKFLALVALFTLCTSIAVADTGKESIGKLKTTIYLGTNDAGKKPCASAVAVSSVEIAKMKGFEGLSFKHYYKIGSDTTNILKALENWSLPLKPSKAITLSYEPAGNISNNSIQLNLDIWQGNKKIMKSAASQLTIGKPMFIRGPAWKNGFLILGVEVITLKK